LGMFGLAVVAHFIVLALPAVDLWKAPVTAYDVLWLR